MDVILIWQAFNPPSLLHNHYHLLLSLNSDLWNSCIGLLMVICVFPIGWLMLWVFGHYCQQQPRVKRHTQSVYEQYVHVLWLCGRCSENKLYLIDKQIQHYAIVRKRNSTNHKKFCNWKLFVRLYYKTVTKWLKI